ncbi:MAG: hypothetical protein IJS30_06465 [Bacteroidales bacterium]|nr:hypothetical protein [Bacteroidales bacterium]MBQ9528967.1 hypothetical protein [Bacteroidales bacterium]
MKAPGIIALAAGLAIVFTGCDAIRSALGKPTSKDIAALRAQAEHMHRTADSLAATMDTALPDSSSITGGDTDTAAGAVAANFADLGTGADGETEAQVAASPDTGPEAGIDTDTSTKEEPAGLAEGFYAVIGSFRNAGNANYLYNSISASGTPVELVRMKNGFTAVMICHSGSYEDTYRMMMDFYRNEKMPEGVWIYNTAKKLHLEQQ